jgi:hypothetical protein
LSEIIVEMWNYYLVYAVSDVESFCSLNEDGPLACEITSYSVE